MKRSGGCLFIGFVGFVVFFAVGAVVVVGVRRFGYCGCDEEEGKGLLLECGEVLME